MANEVNTNLSVTVSTSGQSASGSVSATSDASNDAFIGNEQTVGTASETILMGDIGATPVFLFVKNLDTTNYVEVDAASTFDKFPQKVLPGKAIYLLPQTGTLYIKANTAPVKCWIVSA